MSSVSFIDIFKICIGPSSSHTLGPWLAAKHFVECLAAKFDDENGLKWPKSIEVELLGSLAKTGLGHQTPLGISLGLLREDPEALAANRIQYKISKIKKDGKIPFKKKQSLRFHPQKSIAFNFRKKTTVHPNTVLFTAKNKDEKAIYQQEYYSIGGGEVLMPEKSSKKASLSGKKPAKAMKKANSNAALMLPHHLKSIHDEKQQRLFPYPIERASDLHSYAKRLKSSISHVVYLNERSWLAEDEIKDRISKIAWTMIECIQYGLFSKQEKLPGGLGVRRRASRMARQLLDSEPNAVKQAIKNSFAKDGSAQPSRFLKAMRQLTLAEHRNSSRWLSAFALAVNEQNAAFARVVTAPTNGAAGVIPAVFMHYLCFENKKAGDLEMRTFFLCASEIASLFKKGATLSAAMGGCQAEIGVSSAMAAAALTELSGGNIDQCLAAAEIAMEHHLGLTCDPISGLVQVPCIERNAMGAVKAITASQIALMSDAAKLIVNLDDIIKTMRQTALDMKGSYKETSEAGLAVNVSVAVSEC